MRTECLDCNKSLEDCTCIEDTIEFDKADIEVFIDGIENPAEPNQALKDAAERLEKYSERFDNKDNELVEGVFNPENWGKRLVKEEPKQESLVERMIPLQLKYNLDMMKQETLEEVAERILANNIDGLKDALNDDDLFFFYKGVVQCYGEAMAKWQQERSYSEEEMLEFGEFIFKNTLLVNVKGVEGILKQFKNK
jgi:hypothetical protein